MTPFSIRGLERDAAAGAAAHETVQEAPNTGNCQRQPPKSTKPAKRTRPATGAAGTDDAEGSAADGKPTDQ